MVTKHILSTILALITCSFTAAQNLPEGRVPAGVELSFVTWKEVLSWVDEDRTGLSAPTAKTGPLTTENDGRAIPQQINPPGRKKTLYAYDLSFQIKNNGTQAMKSVEWEYFWAVNGKVESHRQSSGKRVEVGKAAMLKAQYVPSKWVESGFHYPEGMARPQPEVRIRRIVYTNGAKWEVQ